MTKVRIWMNRNYATTLHLMQMLRNNPDGVAVELFGSHTDPTSPMLAGCDHRIREPAVTDPDFVDQLLALCVRHRIDVFLPVAGQALIARRADEFRAVGTALICPEADAIELLADKADTYTALAGQEIVPPWRAVGSLPEFDAAVAELDPLWTPLTPLVLKPSRGVGADGVRFVNRTEISLSALLGPVGPVVGVSTVRSVLGLSSVVPTLLLMPYLPGPETSVDVLAAQGRTLAAVPRTKSGRRRTIGGDPALATLAGELVEQFRLDGLLNVQFRTFAGRPALLEINSRPSGGLYQTALAGVNLPWAAVQLALGHQPGPLRPTLGAEFVTVSSVIPLPPQPLVGHDEPVTGAAPALVPLAS